MRKVHDGHAQKAADTTALRTVDDTTMLHAVHIGKSHVALAVDKPKQPKMQRHFKIVTTHRGTRQHNDNGGRGSLDRRIRAFISGKTHGEDVLHALYGAVADEPIPARLRTLLKA